MDGAALVEADEQPDAKSAIGKGRAGREFLVEFRVEIGKALVDVAVQDEGEDGHHGINRCVADEQPVAVEDVGFEARGHAVHGLADGDEQAAVDDELGKLGGALVTITAVPDEQLGEMVELGDGEIGGEGGLPAFFSHNSNADVGGLDHGDVVATVTNAGDAFVRVGADEEGDVGFLGWGAAAGDYGRQEDGDGDEGEAVVEEKVGEGVAIYKEGCGMWVGIQEGQSTCSSLGVCAGKRREVGDGVNVLGTGDEFGGDGDTAGGFHLVACQHPDFYAGVSEEFE